MEKQKTNWISILPLLISGASLVFSIFAFYNPNNPIILHVYSSSTIERYYDYSTDGTDFLISGYLENRGNTAVMITDVKLKSNCQPYDSLDSSIPEVTTLDVTLINCTYKPALNELQVLDPNNSTMFWIRLFFSPIASEICGDYRIDITLNFEYKYAGNNMGTTEKEVFWDIQFGGVTARF